MDGITLITPTGGRPQAFALCEQFMLAQTYSGALQWFVVDDCLPPTACSAHQLQVVPNPYWSPGQNTQARNLLEAIPHAQYDCIVIIEDDDYYAPRYLEYMVGLLQSADLVGISNAQYYNVRTRTYRQHSNTHHASLCSTAMRRSVLQMLQVVCQEKAKWIDIELWARWSGSKSLKSPFNPALVVGIKGLPGRPGIGRGHIMNPEHGYNTDKDLQMLTTWIGEAARQYKNYYKGAVNGHSA